MHSVSNPLSKTVFGFNKIPRINIYVGWYAGITANIKSKKKKNVSSPCPHHSPSILLYWYNRLRDGKRKGERYIEERGETEDNDKKNSTRCTVKCNFFHRIKTEQIPRQILDLCFFFWKCCKAKSLLVLHCSYEINIYTISNRFPTKSLFVNTNFWFVQFIIKRPK